MTITKPVQRHALFILALLASGCAGDDAGVEVEAQLFARDYDQTCMVHGDCVLVTEGGACACRECTNASIARSAKSEWESDLEEAQRVCDPKERMLCGSLEFETRRQATSCWDYQPTCVDGVCTAVEPAAPDD